MHGRSRPHCYACDMLGVPLHKPDPLTPKDQTMTAAELSVLRALVEWVGDHYEECGFALPPKC